MNWNNVNLTSEYERSRNLLENYTFDTLLLEVHCNLQEINEKTVKAQAIHVINAKYREALELLSANLTNITQQAINERSS